MQATITLIDEEGNAYPVGGCYLAKVSRSATHGYYAFELRIVVPSGDAVYLLASAEPLNSGGTAQPTREMKGLRDKIVAALADSAVNILDLRETASSESEGLQVTSAFS